MTMHLTRWQPDNRLFWESEGERIARRNLAISIPALVLAFAVWMLWSIVVVHLPHVGFRFSTEQLFWLAAVPGLAAGTLRLLFAFMVPIVGGRVWTVVSTLALLVPAIGVGLAVQDPATDYPTFVLLGLACGIGGGNFGSSMANISLFYPSDRQGTALGLNAGLGNAGVALAQFVVPIAIGAAVLGALGGSGQTWSDGATTRQVWLQNAGYVWVPFILAVAAAAWYGMDDIDDRRASLGEQAVIFVRPHTWILSWLYLGTFGSFVGFAAGFPLMAEASFGAAGATEYAFVGALLGALARPVGGWLADRAGGVNIALASFAAMAATVIALLWALPGAGSPGQYGLFLALFVALFVASGVGNGAVFHIIPQVYAEDRLHAAPRDAASRLRAQRDGALEGAAGLGFASAIAAFGSFFIPKSYGASIGMTGGAGAALYVFLVFYASCIALTWWCYGRRGHGLPKGAKR